MANPTPGTAFVVWLIVIVAVGFVMMLLFKLTVWYSEYVNRSIDNDDDDMSSEDIDTPLSRPSSLETDGQTDRRAPQTTAPRAEQLLTLYRLMRAAGISRDEAQAALKEAGLPLNNNVWKLAAPRVPAPSDDDDVLVTPYAGRRTRASYYPDEPELEFKSPA